MGLKQKPVHVIRDGLIRAAIWANPADNHGTRYSVTVTRSYRHDDGWKDSSSFGRYELPAVRKIIDQAERWLYQQPRTD